LKDIHQALDTARSQQETPRGTLRINTGAPACLIMCDEADIQVMCVTCHPEEVTGATVRFASGFNRHGDGQVVLDPCPRPPERLRASGPAPCVFM
jgi:hypothetical protein